MTDYSLPDDGRTQRERMLAGEPYIADESLAADSLRATALVARFNATGADERAERHRILGELFAEIGEHTHIRPPLFVDYGFRIRIGARSFVNFGLMALDVAPITIGNDVQMGPNVQLLTPTHPVEPGPRRARIEGAEPITIGDNVWLGGGVIVLPGVSIGANTVVGAGSVVAKDLPANVVAVGNPARVVRQLEPDA